MGTRGVVAARGQGKQQVCFGQEVAEDNQVRSREKSGGGLWQPGALEGIWGAASKSDPPRAQKELLEQIRIPESAIGINAFTEG